MTRKPHWPILFTLLLTCSAGFATDATERWIRPALPSCPLVWGHRNGIVFGLRSDGGMRGPRGLIRVGVCSTTGTPELINFIAIEPVAKGNGPRHTRMAFSELEPSTLDEGKRGK